MITLKINGQLSQVWGLTPTKGCINQLLKPAAPRAIVFNENRSINGSVALLANRTLQKRNVTLNFLLRSTNNDRELFVDLVNDIQDMLVNGKNGTGVNEIEYVEAHRTYRLAYVDMQTYNAFGELNKALIALRFVELNPANI